jgi:hypothetical protein
MKNTKAPFQLTMLNRVTGQESMLRLMSKPCRNLPTRYWVVVEGPPGSRERWHLEPSIDRAIQYVSRWLAKEAAACLANSGTPLPLSPAGASPKTNHTKATTI